MRTRHPCEDTVSKRFLETVFKFHVVSVQKNWEGSDGSIERNVRTYHRSGAWQIGSKAWILFLIVLVHGEVAKDAWVIDDARETPCSSAHRHRVSEG